MARLPGWAIVFGNSAKTIVKMINLDALRKLPQNGVTFKAAVEPPLRALLNNNTITINPRWAIGLTETNAWLAKAINELGYDVTTDPSVKKSWDQLHSDTSRKGIWMSSCTLDVLEALCREKARRDARGGFDDYTRNDDRALREIFGNSPSPKRARVAPTHEQDELLGALGDLFPEVPPGDIPDFDEILDLENFIDNQSNR